MKVEISLNMQYLDFEYIMNLVANDVVVEIKRLISQGKNTSNIGLKPKKDGSIPDFNDTGLLLDSMTYKIVENGFVIFIDNKDRENVMSFINRRANWTIFEPSEYLDDFISKKIDSYLQQQLNKI